MMANYNNQPMAHSMGNFQQPFNYQPNSSLQPNVQHPFGRRMVNVVEEDTLMKLYYEPNHCRRMKFGSIQKVTLERLREHISSITDISPKNMILKYKDDDDEWITFDTEGEWKDALFFSSPKLRIKVEKDESVEIPSLNIPEQVSQVPPAYEDEQRGSHSARPSTNNNYFGFEFSRPQNSRPQNSGSQNSGLQNSGSQNSGPLYGYSKTQTKDPKSPQPVETSMNQSSNDDDYEKQQALLVDMGFTNREQNLNYLKQYNGDIKACVRTLLHKP